MARFLYSMKGMWGQSFESLLKRRAICLIVVGFFLWRPAATGELAQLLNVTLQRDSAGAAALILELDREVSWSTYRQSDGKLVLGLLRAVAASFLETPVNRIDGIVVEKIETDVDGPVTRIVVEDAGAEYEVVPEGLTVRVTFFPLEAAAGQGQPEDRGSETPDRPDPPAEPDDLTVVESPDSGVEEITTEKMPAEISVGGDDQVEEIPIAIQVEAPAEITEAVETEVEGTIEVDETAIPPAASEDRVLAGVQPYGTASAPFLSPASPGDVAEFLLFVEPSGEGQFRIRADGAMQYRAFSLVEPDRFVLDLIGVELAIDRRRIDGPSAVDVNAVRIGQFSGPPDAVARVVFDLVRPIVPWVQDQGNDLIVTFGEPQQAPLIDLDAIAAVEEPELSADLGGARQSDDPVEDAGQPTLSQVETVEEVSIADIGEPGADTPVFLSVPAGKLAETLLEVVVTDDTNGVVVTLAGDGGFHFSTFTLREPHRFVLDLKGVVVGDIPPSQPGAGPVQTVRVGQHQSGDRAVARVVLDLDLPLMPTIERDGSSLILQVE